MSHLLTLPTVVCHGTQKQMGFQQGESCREHIIAAVDTCTRLEQFRVDMPSWMPRSLFLLIGKMKSRFLLEGPLGKDYPEMQARLRGIARGSRVGSSTIYLANAIEAILSAVGKRVAVPPMACSAIAVRGNRSASNEPILARNFDYLSAVQPYMILRRMNPRTGFRALEFTVAPLVGCIDGMNEKGLCIAYDYAYTTDYGAPSGTVGMLISSALQHCTSVAEAVQFMGSRKRWGGALLMLADAQGDIASLELSGNHHQVRRPAPGSDVVFHTNRFMTPAMRKVEVHDAAVFTKPADVRGLRVHDSADKRYARLDHLIGTYDKLDADSLLACMSDHGFDNKPSDTTVCVHGALRTTVAAMQYFPAQGRMRISLGQTCQPNFVDLKL